MGAWGLATGGASLPLAPEQAANSNAMAVISTARTIPFLSGACMMSDRYHASPAAVNRLIQSF